MAAQSLPEVTLGSRTASRAIQSRSRQKATGYATGLLAYTTAGRFFFRPCTGQRTSQAVVALMAGAF